MTTRLVWGGALVLVAASLVTCRLDKLIRPVTADRLMVSPGILRDSAPTGSRKEYVRELLIATADGATLPWSATTSGAPWLTLSRTSGGAPDTLVISLHPDTLSQVVHHDTIVFRSIAAPHDTVRIPVVFDILPPAPELVVTPLTNADSAFAGSAESRTFVVHIDNSGAVSLTWSAATPDAWLTLSRDSGSAPPTDSTIVTLTPGGLAAATHTGTVTITAPGAIDSAATITVSFRIKPCDEPAIGKDTTVSGSITLSDCGAAQQAGSQAKRYAVNANAGDTLSFRLESAAFDAYLAVFDNSGALLRDNDDCPSQTGPACIRDLAVLAGGRYVIEATTAVAAATGAFTLSVARERAPSLPQSLGQFRGDSVTAIAVGAATPGSEAVFKATVNDSNSRDSVRLEIEVVETASPFSGTANHQSAYVGGGQTAWIRVTGLIENAGYHWRARTCDTTSRCSAWLGFGSNADAEPDLFVNAIPEDPTLDAGSLNQLSGSSTIAVGGGAGGTPGGTQTVTFRAIVNDPDPKDVIVLEVESKTTTTEFNGTSDLFRGAGVTSGTSASTAAVFPVPVLLSTSYHWRARACDQTGRCGAWTAFGGNSDTVGVLDPADTDFHVP